MFFKNFGEKQVKKKKKKKRATGVGGGGGERGYFAFPLLLNESGIL